MRLRLRARWTRWALVPLVLVLAVLVAAVLLRDWRIRLRTLRPLDPPPGPAEVIVGGHRLSITGARVTGVDGGGLGLFAWAPNPSLRVVEAAGPGTITVTLTNLPRRARIEAAGPVDDQPAGPTRRLAFAPQLTRRLAVAGPEQPISFFVLGDTGDNPGFGAALRLADIKGADFLLHTGDVVYDDAQIPNIRDLVATAALPIYFVRGNHDYRNDRRVAFLRELGPPFYVFRIGGATFVALDNAGDYLPILWRYSTQYAWWRSVLGEPRSGPLFVVMHKPPFDRRTGPRRAAMLDERFARQLHRDFRQAGVDTVFTGHVHAAHLWVEDGLLYVVSGEGFESPLPSGENRVAWARLRDGQLAVEFIPIWRGGGR